MPPDQRAARRPSGPQVINPDGQGRLVLSVDHATNAVPGDLAGLGLDEDALASHIAWDPGALAVALRLASMLDAPVVHPDASRLVIDVNRDPGGPDSIVERSDGTVIPGNAALDTRERARRIERHYRPFHDALERLIAARIEAGRSPALASVHSFTPVLAGRERPWDVGIIHDAGHAFADAIIDTLSAESALTVGRNEPYGPGDRVYHTLSHHAESRGFACAMIEIRADRIATAAGEEAWARRLGGALTAALAVTTA